jgi:hypothetical protein
MLNKCIVFGAKGTGRILRDVAAIEDERALIVPSTKFQVLMHQQALRRGDDRSEVHCHLPWNPFNLRMCLV